MDEIQILLVLLNFSIVLYFLFIADFLCLLEYVLQFEVILDDVLRISSIFIECDIPVYQTTLLL